MLFHIGTSVLLGEFYKNWLIIKVRSALMHKKYNVDVEPLVLNLKTPALISSMTDNKYERVQNGFIFRMTLKDRT